MNRCKFTQALCREALASAVSQRTGTSLTAVVVAAMCVAVLLTAGQTAATEQAVLAAIDQADTRTITVSATAQSGLTTDVLAQLAAITGIESTAAFGPAIDGTNMSAPRALIGVRTLWTNPADLGIPVTYTEGRAWASDQGLAALGMPDRTGTIRTTQGTEITVAGRCETPQQLDALEPLVVIPARPSTAQPVAVLIITATSSKTVAPVTDLVNELLTGLPPGQIKVNSSQELAALRNIVEADLQGHSRSQVLMIMSATAILVAVLQSVMAILRRKDYGRRRALGASQALILALVIIQTAIIAIVTAVVTTLLCVAAMIVLGTPVPSSAFVTAVPILAVGTATFAALAPAVLAARRDPLTELRVP